MAEVAEEEPRPVTTSERFPREAWKAPAAQSGPYGVALDRHGKLHLNKGDANGDALIVVTTTDVSAGYLAELRRDGISYLFAGEAELDLGLALETLRSEFGVERLLLKGGGGINRAFLAAGLIDEISLLVLPLADGAMGTPILIDRVGGSAMTLDLLSADRLDAGVVRLCYRVEPLVRP